MAYRIVALDMDGTLLHDDHSLSSANVEAIREVAAQGVEIVLCTGRSPTSTLPYLKEIGLDGVLITHNGAATIASQNCSVLHQFDIPAVDLKPYTEYCRDNGIHFDVNTVFDLYVDKLHIELEMIDFYHQFLIEPKPFPKRGSSEIKVVKLTIHGHKEEMDQVENELNEWTHKCQWIRSGDAYIDMMHKKATKGNALQQLAMMRGVPSEHVFVIGNYYNDMTMIRYAGMGIAMANAPLNVKAVAKDVTLSNNENGVAAALHKYFL